MPCHLIALLAAFSSGAPVFAQTPRAKADQAAIVALAQEAVVRALDFHQGDLASLTDARGDFTPEGWSAFLKHMEGWLDANGTPTFSSSFVPSGVGRVIGEENGVLHVRIPGTLKQTQNSSSTTYGRAAVEVRVSGKPPKIQHLEQITCARSSTACQ
jgi:hypothetical protein